MNIVWLSCDELMPKMKKKLNKVSIVLDIGCGIVPQNYIHPRVHICCEPYDEYVNVLQKNVLSESDRSYIILRATWQEVVNIFPVKSVDTIIISDVIEHLEKEEGKHLLKITERIARHQIAVFTPLGFFPQTHPDGIDNWNLHGASWQEHKSGWLPEDFDASWEIFASKDFHKTGPKGNILNEPFGAFWALKNIDSDEFGNKRIISKWRRFYLWREKIKNRI